MCILRKDKHLIDAKFEINIKQIITWVLNFIQSACYTYRVYRDDGAQ